MKPRSWRPRSIKALLVYLTLAIIGPAALASACLIAWNVGEAKKAREEQLLNSAQMVSAAVDLRIAQLSTTAQAIAGTDALRADDWPGVRRRIDRFHLGDRSWVAVSDAAGRRLLNTFPGPQAAAAGLPRPASVQAAVRTGRPVVSDLFRGSASGRFVVSVDAPVEDDPSGKVVTLVLEAAALRDLLRDFPTTAGVMMITLVDGRRRVVARTRDHEAFVGVPATAQMQAALREASSGVTPSVSLDGDPTVVAFHRSDLTGWTAMVVVPRSELTAPILANAAVLSAGVLAVLLLALFGAIALGGVLTREMGRLEDDAVLLGWNAYVEEARQHGQAPQLAAWAVEMGRDTFENWQSEFLQLLWQVVGLAYFLYVGVVEGERRPAGGKDRRPSGTGRQRARPGPSARDRPHASAARRPPGDPPRAALRP